MRNTTEYFKHTRKRADRKYFDMNWIEYVLQNPVKEEVQADGRIRKWGWIMKIKYFQDTDTALIEFSQNTVSETREVSENIYVDIDSQGNLVSMTIEHAKSTGALKSFSYEEIDKTA